MKTVGCMLSVELTSNGGHKIKWDSQPVVKRKPQRNLFLSAAIVFAGNTFKQTINWHHALIFNFQRHTEKIIVPCYSRGMGG